MTMYNPTDLKNLWIEFDRDTVNSTFNNLINIRDLVEGAGIDIGKGGRFKCFSHNDSNPSMSINKKNNTCHCFSCNCTSGVIDTYRTLYTNYEKKDYKSLILDMCEQFDVDVADLVTDRQAFLNDLERANGNRTVKQTDIPPFSVMDYSLIGLHQKLDIKDMVYNAETDDYEEKTIDEYTLTDFYKENKDTYYEMVFNKILDKAIETIHKYDYLCKLGDKEEVEFEKFLKDNNIPMTIQDSIDMVKEYQDETRKLDKTCKSEYDNKIKYYETKGANGTLNFSDKYAYKLLLDLKKELGNDNAYKGLESYDIGKTNLKNCYPFLYTDIGMKLYNNTTIFLDTIKNYEKTTSDIAKLGKMYSKVPLEYREKAEVSFNKDYEKDLCDYMNGYGADYKPYSLEEFSSKLYEHKITSTNDEYKILVENSNERNSEINFINDLVKKGARLDDIKKAYEQNGMTFPVLDNDKLDTINLNRRTYLTKKIAEYDSK